MIKVGDKKWSQLEDNQKIAYCKDNLVQPVLDERRRLDWKWYIAKRFQAGDQYVQYNTVTNSIENPPRKRGAVRLVINIIRAHTRAVKNFVTSSNPKFEVMPGDLDEETMENARRSGEVLDYLQQKKLYLLSKVRTAIDDVVDTTVGFFELGWDDEAEGGIGQVTLDTVDPFELVIPLTAYMNGPVIHSPFIAKVLPRDIGDIHSDSKYDEKTRKEVKPDEEIAASESKRKILREYGRKGERAEGQQTAMVYEVLLWDAEGNDEGGKINIFTFAGDKVLRDEETDMEEYPIYAFQDEPRRTLYGEASMTWNMIAPQKGINRLESQKLEDNNNTLRTRILAEKGHGVNFAVTGRGGTDIEVIEHNPGRRVDFWQANPVNDGGQSDRFMKYMEILSGVHEAMFGINPAGGRSGEMLEQLQAAGANNLAGLQMSLQNFLEVIGSRILDVVADKYVASRVVKIADEEGREAFTKVAGEGAQGKPEGAVIINKDNELQVRIGSWLGYTKEAQRQTLRELGTEGFIDTETVLRMLDFPNVDAVARRARQERLEEFDREAEIAGRRETQQETQAQESAQPAQTPTAGGFSDVALADEENARMMNGEEIPPTPNASLAHSQAHVDFLQSAEAQQNPQGMENIRVHVQGELTQQQTQPQGVIA